MNVNNERIVRHIYEMSAKSKHHDSFDEVSTITISMSHT